MIREYADEKRQARIDQALDPPTIIDSSGRPSWWVSDAEAWAELKAQL